MLLEGNVQHQVNIDAAPDENDNPMPFVSSPGVQVLITLLNLKFLATSLKFLLSLDPRTHAKETQRAMVLTSSPYKKKLENWRELQLAQAKVKEFKMEFASSKSGTKKKETSTQNKETPKTKRTAAPHQPAPKPSPLSSYCSS